MTVVWTRVYKDVVIDVLLDEAAPPMARRYRLQLDGVLQVIEGFSQSPMAFHTPEGAAAGGRRLVRQRGGRRLVRQRGG